jgi:hypothetical protein
MNAPVRSLGCYPSLPARVNVESSRLGVIGLRLELRRS